MSQRISRRKLITAGLSTAAGASGLALAARLADRHGLIPPDHGGIFGVGETLTYASHRLLTARNSFAREFDASEISSVAPVNGKPPQDETFQHLLAGSFADWHLPVDGLVDRPSSFSLAELRGYPSSTQITHLACEEGWSYIAEWTGIPLSRVLNLVGVQPQARYVVFFTVDLEWGFESIDMADAWHPQTLLAFAMNGQDLPLDYGAPLRLRLPRQLGYKNIKWLSRITVTDSMDGFGQGLGSTAVEYGYSWYAGI